MQIDMRSLQHEKNRKFQAPEMKFGMNIINLW